MREVKPIELIRRLKKKDARERWWWRHTPIPKALRLSALLYELAARIDASATKNQAVGYLPYWLQHPWPELKPQHQRYLDEIWPQKISPTFCEIVWPEAIADALKQPQATDQGEWSPWCLVRFNLQHENNALLKALSGHLNELREACGQDLHESVGKGHTRRTLSFRCVEILDKTLFDEMVLDASTDRYLRRQLDKYEDLIENGRQALLQNPPK